MLRMESNSILPIEILMKKLIHLIWVTKQLSIYFAFQFETFHLFVLVLDFLGFFPQITYSLSQNKNFESHFISSQSNYDYVDLEIEISSSRPKMFYIKMVFFKISQNLQENTYIRVYFINRFADLRPAICLKKRLQHRFFPLNFAKFLGIPFL